MATEKIYLLIFLLFFFGLVFFFRSFLLWKQTGINPITYRGADDAHDFNSLVFTIISLLILVTALLYAFGGSNYEYLLPIWYLELATLKMIGWGMMHLSIFWIFAAQLQMANSWRIGIDTETETELVQTGLFKYSRNPIFFGIMLSYLGFFLVLPNALTFTIGILSFTTIHIQVRLEEAFLKSKHRRRYEIYQKEVRRWI